jgi:cobalt-zinc-cadmium efflux system outer membrane protein
MHSQSSESGETGPAGTRSRASRAAARRGAKAWRPLVASGLLALTVACRSYEAVPLDPSEHLAEFEGRDAVPSAHADPGRVTLEGAEALLGEHNPEVRAARAAAGTALAAARQAGLWPDLSLQGSLSEALEGPEPLLWGLQLAAALPWPGRLDAERRLARRRFESAWVGAVHAEWNAREALHLGWGEASVQEARVADLRAAAIELDAWIDQSERWRELGDLSATEVRALAIQRQALELAIDRADSRARALWREVREHLGLPPSADFAGRPVPLEAAREPDPAPPYERNLEVARRRLEYAVSEAQLELQILRQLPGGSVNAGLGEEEGWDRFLFGFNVPLPLWNANRLAIATAEGQRAQARVTWEVAREQLAQAWWDASERWRDARRQEELCVEAWLSLLEIQSAQLRELAELGERRPQLWLQTWTQRIEAQQARWDTARDRWRQEVRLRFLDAPDLSLPDLDDPFPATEALPTPEAP